MQLLDDGAPSIELNFPKGHATHEDMFLAPVAFEKYPGLHATHMDSSWLLYRPAEQVVHDDSPALLYLPGSHDMHCDGLEDLFKNCPAIQKSHVLDAFLVFCVFGGHILQEMDPSMGE